MYTILVVDDEQTIRKGIIQLISENGNYKVVGEAEDGETALEMALELMPDIIISDINMPKMDGLEFIQNLKNFSMHTKIIIISGYDEFEFAQQALKLNVSDYILKPINQEDLLAVIERVCKEIDQNNKNEFDMEHLRTIVKESLPAARERFFNQLVTGKINKNEIESKLNYLNLNITGKLFAIAILKIVNLQGDNVTDLQPEDVVMSLLSSEGQKMFPEHISIFPFFYHVNNVAVLMCSKDIYCNKFFLNLNNSFSHLIALIKKTFNIEIYVSIGKAYEELESLYKCFQETEDALEHRILSNKASIINFEDLHIHKGRHFNRPIELEKELLIHIKFCQKEQADKTIQDMFAYYNSLEKMTLSLIKSFVFEICIMIIRTVEDTIGNNNHCNIIEVNPYVNALKLDSCMDLNNWLLKIVQLSIDQIQEGRDHKKVSLIQKAQQLIETYQFETDLSVEFLSEKLFISPNYLRQLFKQQIGKTFVEYLTKLRIEAAMKLLDNPTLKIQEVSDQVGYNDARYFTFCFKKYCQITPSEYRELKASH